MRTNRTNNNVNAKWDSAERIFTQAGVSRFQANTDIKTAATMSAKPAATDTASPKGKKSSHHPSRIPHQQHHHDDGATVSYLKDNQLLPAHMRSILTLLEQNISALRHFSSRFHMMTNSELHAAGINLNALVGSQEVCLRDLSHFTAKEVQHGRERIRDLSVQLHTEKDEIARQIHTMELLYHSISSVADITAAKEAMLFLFPRGKPIGGFEKQKNHNTPAEDSNRRRSTIGNAGGHNLNQNSALTVSATSRGSRRSSATPSQLGGSTQPPPRTEVTMAAMENGAEEALSSNHHLGGDGVGEAEFPLEQDSGSEEHLLSLIAHVSTDCFDSLSDGSTSPEIYEICKAVAESKCAANIVTSSAGPKRSFDSIVACPILPQGELAPIGVLCVVNKLAAYEPEFSTDDECRVIYTGEQIAQLLATYPLTVSARAPLLVTPHSFQQIHQEWVGPENQRPATPSLRAAASIEKKKMKKASSNNNWKFDRDDDFPTPGGTLPSNLRDPISKKFIFRATHNGKMLDELRNVRSRLAVSPAEVLLDVLARYRNLEKQLDTVTKRLSSAQDQVDVAHKEVLQAKENARKFELQSAEMQVASERVLRMAFLQGRAGGKDSELVLDSQDQTQNTTTQANTHRTPVDHVAENKDKTHSEDTGVVSPPRSPGSMPLAHRSLPATPAPPNKVVDLSVLPDRFVRSANSLKTKSFFPSSSSFAPGQQVSPNSSSRSVSTIWNSKSKVAMASPAGRRHNSSQSPRRNAHGLGGTSRR